MNGDGEFIDTNVLLYAYDAKAEAKHAIARRTLARLWRSGTGLISVQVLQEFYVNAVRKLATPLPPVTARSVLEFYGTWPVHRPAVADLLAASRLAEAHHLSFWDANVIVSAQQLGAVRLLTEDQQPGRRFGNLIVENPFAA